MDLNNMKDTQRKKDHMYSDILGGTGTGRLNQSAAKKGGRKEPKLENDLQFAKNDWQTPSQTNKKGYKPENQKHDQLRSALDTHDY